MILIQTLWRCARTLITTTTLSLLFHYSLSLLLYSTVQGRRKQGGRRGQTPPSDFVRYVNLISIRGQIMPTSHCINKYLPPPPCTIFSDLLTALQCTVVKLTSLVIIVACWQETILLMMSTTPASLYALVINALLFIGFYTKMRCPQIALTFSGIAPLKCSYYLLKPANDVLNVTWSANLYIDLFYTLRDYTIYTYNLEIQKCR